MRATAATPTTTPASESNAAAEQVVGQPGQPDDHHDAERDRGHAGHVVGDLEDTAVLSGGYYETGTITFTLYQGSTLVDTETVPVSGNGSYTTPTGYTLPTTGTVTGTYQWDASYSGDTNNNSASESNAAAEQVVGQPGEPDDHHDAERDRGHAGDVAGDPERHGGALGRLLRDRHDHVHALPGQHAGGHRDGGGQRQRQLHDADGLHAADDGHGDRAPTSGMPATAATPTTSRRARATPRPSRSSVSPASPTITTTPSVTSVTLGTSSVTSNDTATLSGRLLRDRHDHVHALPGQHAVVTRRRVAVSGNGTYSTTAGDSRQATRCRRRAR